MFPAYLPVASQQDIALIEQLCAHHLDMEQTWQRLNTQLSQRITHPSINDIQLFRALYQQHMSVEEPLFSRIQSALQADVLHALGMNMAQRRK